MFSNAASNQGVLVSLIFGVDAMTQSSLEEMIAKTTGDDLRDIRRIGFQLADPVVVNSAAEPSYYSPNYVDWDDIDRQRATNNY